LASYGKWNGQQKTGSVTNIAEFAAVITMKILAQKTIKPRATPQTAGLRLCWQKMIEARNEISPN
jgi:hypothetical protein